MIKRLIAPDLIKMRERGHRIAVVTAYDYLFANLADRAGIDVLLVGDSLGAVFQGKKDTLSVTVDEIIYHVKAVVQGSNHALIAADMPFMSYQTGPRDALISAGRIIKEGGAQAVKLEGGEDIVPQVEAIVSAGIPVIGHVGLLPQSVNMLGYRVQGRDEESSKRVLNDSLALEKAGVCAIVLEGIPSELATKVTSKLQIPTIGIGAGAGCSGQVLVNYDLLGLTNYEESKRPKFVKEYRTLREEVSTAFKEYIDEVRAGTFPTDEESYK